MKSFTLIELIIGLVIFGFILFFLGSLLSSVTSTEFRAIAVQRLASQTRTALEVLGREVRLAQKNGNPCTPVLGQSFDITQDVSSLTLKFKDFDGRCIIYSYTPPSAGVNGAIKKQIIDGPKISPQILFLGTQAISNGINVKSFLITSLAGVPQSRITLIADVQTNDPTSAGAFIDFYLQTTLSQRGLL